MMIEIVITIFHLIGEEGKVASSRDTSSGGFIQRRDGEDNQRLMWARRGQSGLLVLIILFLMNREFIEL